MGTRSAGGYRATTSPDAPGLRRTNETPEDVANHVPWLYAQLSPITPEPCSWLPTALRDDIKELILCFANYYDLDGPKVLHIGICESNLRPEAKNAHSSASGVFQFISGTWNSTVARYRALYGLWDGFTGSPFTAYDNVRLGTWLMSVDGYRHWECT